MDNITQLQQSVNKAYKLLPANSKHLASSNIPCSESYFRTILKGGPKNAQAYINALKAIHKVSQDLIDLRQKHHIRIDKILKEITAGG